MPNDLQNHGAACGKHISRRRYLGPGRSLLQASDPQIEADTKWLREQVLSFSSYRGKVAGLGPEDLLQAVVRLEEINERAQKLLAYAYLNFSTQTSNPAASALFQSRKELYSEIRRDTLFFEIEWSKLEDSRAEELASGPLLSKYHHYLISLRRYKPHLLSEPEERILAEKEPAGASAWGALFDKMLSQLRFGEKKRTESEVLSDIYSPDREVRKRAATELSDGLQSILLPLTHIFNTILLDKSIEDRLRQYPHWLSSRNLSNEADDAMVGALVNAVCFQVRSGRNAITVSNESFSGMRSFSTTTAMPLFRSWLRSRRHGMRQKRSCSLPMGIFLAEMEKIALPVL